jgi:hypothetical protein
MCLAVYVASDVPLPKSDWNEHAPAFYLKPVSERAGVRKQFLYSRVYYAGSHEGCGCGFLKDGADGQELERRQENYRSLADVLSAATGTGAQLQLFTCWEGDQTKSPRTTGLISLEELIEPGFELQELSLLTVRRSP